MSSNLSERQKLRYVENSAGESREESLVRHHLFYYWLREEPFHFVLRLAGARFIWWATDWPSSVATQREADAFTEPFIVAQTAPHQVAPVTSELYTCHEDFYSPPAYRTPRLSTKDCICRSAAWLFLGFIVVGPNPYHPE